MKTTAKQSQEKTEQEYDNDLYESLVNHQVNCGFERTARKIAQWMSGNTPNAKATLISKIQAL